MLENNNEQEFNNNNNNTENEEVTNNNIENEETVNDNQEDIFAEPEMELSELETEETAQDTDENTEEQFAEPVIEMPTEEDSKTAKKHKKKMNAYVKALCCAIIFGLVAGSMIMGSVAISKNTIAKNQTAIETNATKLSTAASDSSSDSSTTTTSGKEYTVSQIAKNCKSSVVAITNKSVSEVQSMFGTTQQESTSSGSGVIIGKNSTELLIATNNHVVADSETLTVCFNDSKDAVFDAQIKGTDSDNDLAVIAIKLSDISEDVLKSISVATIGESKSLVVGDQVVAIGNALGIGQSVTSGIVSAVDREVTIDNTTATLLQTDAAINPGNSGGALFNMKGELIGINSAKYASEEVEGMGFAIPMAKAQTILENLMKQETREKLSSNYGYLGISGKSVDSDTAKMYNVPEGVYVADVTSGGAAEKAGLKAGDIITKLGSKTITTISELKDELQYYKAGEQVKVVVERNSENGYKEKTVTVTLDNASKQSSSNSNSNSNGNSSQSGQEDQSGSYYGNGNGNSGNSRGNGYNFFGN